MMNQALEREISELIVNIRENKVLVRPEREWIQDKYERYRRKLENQEGRSLTKTQTDERLYQELYHTAPLKYSQITKIRYWRSGTHFPGNFNETMRFVHALGLEDDEIRYFFHVCLDQNYFADEGERQEAVQLLQQLKIEFQQKFHPAQLLSYGIRKQDICRQKELQQMDEILDKEHKVLLYGIGGIGKSALARFYGYRKQQQEIRVIILTCQKNVLEMIVSDAQLKISNYTYNVRQYRSRRAYFRAKLQALTEIAQEEKILVIVDDFNLEKDRYLRELLEVPCDFIFTSRVIPEFFDEKSRLLIRGIAEEEWEDFCQLYLKKDYPDNRIVKKRCEVENHTLFMKLYLFKLSKEDLKESDIEIGKESKEVLRPLQGLDLKKQEKFFLLWMSLLPVEGISKELFCLICGIEEKQLERLLQWNLLEESTQTETGEKKLRIHSIIAGDIQKQLIPSYRNCRFFLERFTGYLAGELNGIETWNRSYEENVKLVEPVLCITRKFRNPPVWMLRKYDEFATLLWVQGYFDEAEKISRTSFEKSVRSCGMGNKLTAYLAGRVAAVYHNRSMHAEADQWYQKSLECFEQIPESEITEEVARDHMDILTKLQRKAWLEEDHEAADRYYHKALQAEQIREKTAEEGAQELLFAKRCVQYAHMYYALSLSRRGQPERAEKLMLDGMAEPQIRSSRFCYMEFCHNYARVLYEKSGRLPENLAYRKENLQKAELLIRKTIESTKEFRGSQYYYMQQQKELLADILIAEGKGMEGEKVLEEIIGALQEEFPYDEVWMERVMKKFRAVRSGTTYRTDDVTGDFAE